MTTRVRGINDRDSVTRFAEGKAANIVAKV